MKLERRLPLSPISSAVKPVSTQATVRPSAAREHGVGVRQGVQSTDSGTTWIVTFTPFRHVQQMLQLLPPR
ncbi:hypothetical protein ACRAWF_24015, partial [Streptomyces sp. L7]